jgi:hypothetical protein
MVALIAVVPALAACPATASAAECGTASKPGAAPAKGTVELAKTSDTDAAFGRGRGTKLISLTFDVKGCELPAGGSAPTLELLTVKGVGDLPEDSVSLRRATPDGTSMDVVLAVDGEKLSPGSFGALAVLRTPNLATARVSITASRSDHRWWIPILLGAAAAAALFGITNLVRFATLTPARRKDVNWPFVLGVAAISIGAGALAALWVYLSQDVWVFDENVKGTLAAGATAATSGTVAGLMPKIWPD